MVAEGLEHKMAIGLKDRVVILLALMATVAIMVGAVVTCFRSTGGCSLENMALTPDQQGARLFSEERYIEAREKFRSPCWQATSLFRAGEFEQAAGIYTGLASAEAAYNRGNALIMLGKYEDAVPAYDQALQMRPGWEDAEVNRAIAAGRAERLKREGGDMTGGKMGADEISFESGKPPEGASDEVIEQEVFSEVQMREIWLRNVKTSPADFLKTKFAYQYAMKGQR